MATENHTRNKSTEAMLARFARYLYARRGVGEVTVHNYVSAIRRLVPELGLRPTARAIETHIARMYKSGASYSHIVNTSLELEVYSTFLGKPIQLGRPKKPKPLVRNTLTEAEVTLLIAAAGNLRERAILSVLAYAGLRNKELCRLRIADINLAAQVIHVAATKTQKDRNANISGPCVAVLSEYLRERDGRADDYLFITLRAHDPYQPQDLRKLVHKVATRAGINKHVWPHLLRHSLATNMLHRGAHLLAIKEQLGHAFVETTMIYVHSDPEHTQMQYRMYAPSYL